MIEIHDLLRTWLKDQGFIYYEVLDAFGIETARGDRIFAYLRFGDTSLDNKGLVIGETIDLKNGTLGTGHTWTKWKVFSSFEKPDVFDEIQKLVAKSVEHLWQIYGRPDCAFVSRLKCNKQYSPRI